MGMLIASKVILDSPKVFKLDTKPPFKYLGSSTALLVVSANTGKSLEQQMDNVVLYAKENPGKALDLAYTLAVRREYLPHRAFALFNENKVINVSTFVRTPAKVPGITMIFTGQGAQWPRMGFELIQRNASFREDIQKMDCVLQKMTHPPSWSIQGHNLHRFPSNVAKIAQMNC